MRADLEDPKVSILCGCPEEGPICVVILALTGRASAHLHNGVQHVGDENTYVSDFLISEKSAIWILITVVVAKMNGVLGR